MKRVASIIGAILIGLATVTLSAHMVTFKGTALDVAKESVTVNVVDSETKKVSKKVFVVDAETKVLRADVLVKFADAKIQKGEAISVTVDHDLDEELAQVIRLGAAK